MARFPALMSTAQISEELGIARTTVLKYIAGGLLRPLVHTERTILVAGDEFARFKREDWPHLPKRRGRPRADASAETKKRLQRLSRELQRAMGGRK